MFLVKKRQFRAFQYFWYFFVQLGVITRERIPNEKFKIIKDDDI